MKIVEKRKVFYTVSISVIVLGLIFALYNAFGLKQGAFNFGIDFVGGTVLEMDLGQETDIEEVKDLVYNVTKDKNAQIQEVIGSNNVIVKLSTGIVEEEVASDDAETAEEAVQYVSENTELKSNAEVVAEVLASKSLDDSNIDLVIKAFEVKYGVTEDSLVELSDFAATVGKEMTSNALTSILLACLAILIYVSFRFNDSKMGFAAILALCHDVLVVLAITAIFRLPIGNSFIASILTVVGYSINNTIVIFDRIRENGKKNARAHKDILINKSIKETMTRTINTSVTTLLSVLALYFLGVDSIKEFVLPLIAGLLAGTWSSVTIAGPIWFDFCHIGKAKVKEATVVEAEIKGEKIETKKVAKKGEKKITKNPDKAARTKAKNAKKNAK